MGQSRRTYLFLLVYTADSLYLIEFRYDRVRGMGDDRAEHAGDVASNESDRELLGLGAVGAGLGHDEPGNKHSFFYVYSSIIVH